MSVSSVSNNQLLEEIIRLLEQLLEGDDSDDAASAFQNLLGSSGSDDSGYSTGDTTTSAADDTDADAGTDGPSSTSSDVSDNTTPDSTASDSATSDDTTSDDTTSDDTTSDDTTTNDTTSTSSDGSSTVAGADDSDAATAIADNLEQTFGLTATQAAGVLGNLEQESGLSPDINQGGTEGAPSSNNADDNENGYGLAQWGGTRKEGLEEYASEHGESAGSMAANLGYMDQELEGSYSGTISAIKSDTTASSAALTWDEDYEEASDPEMSNRDQYANQFLSEGL